MTARERHHDSSPAEQRDLFCFSHLRWHFVFQRPQHLMTRFARTRRVFFVEEPLFVDGGTEQLLVDETGEGVIVLTPQLSSGLDARQRIDVQQQLLQRFVTERHVRSYDAWYYTPMALEVTALLTPVVTVYDCMDELSAFAFAPPQLHELEQQLFARADLVFTGGASLYEAKRRQHRSVHLFPSSVDRAHFEAARTPTQDPADQRELPHPRLGFFGVLDERLDLGLVENIARLRPEWSLVLIGPVVKIDPESLPRAHNIHYFGAKHYSALPAYLAGWDVATMPFARNDSTRFISPTKTPEYLAAGKPVISTSIADVVRPYGETGIVSIADTADAFVREAERLLSSPPAARAEWLRRVDDVLSEMSWDRTWSGMDALMTRGAAAPRPRAGAVRQTEVRA